MKDQGKNVTITSVSTVLPADPAPYSTHYLSNIDLLYAGTPVYMQLVYYFRTKKGESEVSSAQGLKDSLSKALSVYPVFAGRLRQGYQGRLEVHVNGAGIPFIEASTEACLDDWPDLHECELEEELNPRDIFIHNVLEDPLIRVQFTSFQCGGVVIGISSMHMITDGLAVMQFVRSWGEIHRRAQLSSPPNFESTRLKPRDPPTVSIADAEELFSDFRPFDWTPPQTSHRYKNKVFRIERDMIEKCRSDVESGAFSYGSASSFEALSALFWSAVTRARGQDDSTAATFDFIVNVRDKLQPPLPKGYFGNAIILTHVTASAGDLKSNDISFAASLIHKRIQDIDSEYITSALDYMELRLQQQLPIGVGTDTTNGNSVVCSSWANFPVYELDFGWRKLDHYELTMLDIMPVSGMLHYHPPPPTADKRSRRIKLRLREDHLDNLLNDHVFQLYFSTK